MAIGMSVAPLQWELQRDYLWEVTLPDVGGANGVEVGRLVQDVKFGDYNIEEITRIYYGGFRKGYVGFLEIQQVTLVILASVPDVAISYFRAWKGNIITSSGLFYPKNNYARDVYITMLDRAGKPVNKFRLRGTFPQTFPSYDLSYGSEKVVEYTVTLNVDTLELR